jgi:mannosyltransferase OCH1-like enzyme
MDRVLLVKLTELQQLTPPPRAAALAETVRSNPHNTAAAISLLVALRQSGALRQRRSGAGGIPKAIAQFWDSTEIPPDIASIMQSWPAMNPDWKIHRFNMESAQSYLAAYFALPVLQAFLYVREPAQKADIFRLAWLSREGGVYADADDRCLAPLAKIVPRDAALVFYQEDYGTIGNNFIAAYPMHPVLVNALHLAVTAINRGDTDIVWLSTGPGLLTRAFAEFLAAQIAGPELPTGVIVLDRRELFRTVGVHCAAGYKQTNRHWSNSSFARTQKRGPNGPETSGRIGADGGT